MFRTNPVIFFFLISCLFFSRVKALEKNIYDLISENPNLSIFFNYLDKTGLGEILKQESPLNWTVFAPSNTAFDTLPKRLKKEILINDFLSQSLFMDHILAKYKTSKNLNKKSKEITVSNKSLELNNFSDLFVKDMIVSKKDLIAKNGVIHIIDCIMFVQPSIQDDRLSDDIKKKYPITSCCMRQNKEVSLWISNFYKKNE